MAFMTPIIHHQNGRFTLKFSKFKKHCQKRTWCPYIWWYNYCSNTKIMEKPMMGWNENTGNWLRYLKIITTNSVSSASMNTLHNYICILSHDLQLPFFKTSFCIKNYTSRTLKWMFFLLKHRGFMFWLIINKKKKKIDKSCDKHVLKFDPKRINIIHL